MPIPVRHLFKPSTVFRSLETNFHCPLPQKTLKTGNPKPLRRRGVVGILKP